MKKTLVLLFAGIVFACIFAPTCFAKSHIKTIDFEHHYYTPEIFIYTSNRKECPYLDKKTKGIVAREGQVAFPLGAKSLNSTDKNTTIYDDIINLGEQRIKNMDKAGIDIAVMSYSTDIEELPKAESVKFAKMANDAIYELTKKYPDRFLGSATLPTPYVDEAIKELKRCKQMGFVYWHTHSNYKNEHLYDKKYEPLLKVAADLNMPVYVHPQTPNDADMRDTGMMYPGAGLGFGQDVMKTTLRMILNGTFDRNPNLKMIIGHLGEYYPFVLDRMDNRFSLDKSTQNKHEISYYFKNNIYVTTSGNESKEAVFGTAKVLGIDHILFGSDYPFENAQDMVEVITKSKLLSKKDKEKILYKNAEKYILNNK